MSDTNKTILIGRLTRDVEIKHTPIGSAVGSFSLAVNKTWSKDGEKKEYVSFINCVAWGKTAEIIAEYVKKGQRVCIIGHLQQRGWEDKTGAKRSTTEVIVDEFQFLTPNDGAKQKDTAQPSFDELPPVVNNPFSDDNIPF
jgi:single-strand DNA-binding protein